MIKYAHLISVYVCKYAQAPHTLFVFRGLVRLFFVSFPSNLLFLFHLLASILCFFILLFLFILRQFDGAHSRVTKCCLVFISVAFMSYIEISNFFFLFDSHFSVSFFYLGNHFRCFKNFLITFDVYFCFISI